MPLLVLASHLQSYHWQRTGKRSYSTSSGHGAGCYRLQCRQGGLDILVRDVSYSCHVGGQEVTVHQTEEDSAGRRWTHSGSVFCPHYGAVCGGQPPLATHWLVLTLMSPLMSP